MWLRANNVPEDRGNIGNAQVAGMGAELGLSSAQYNMALTGEYRSCFSGMGYLNSIAVHMC